MTKLYLLNTRRWRRDGFSWGNFFFFFFSSCFILFFIVFMIWVRFFFLNFAILYVYFFCWRPVLRIVSMSSESLFRLDFFCIIIWCREWMDFSEGDELLFDMTDRGCRGWEWERNVWLKKNRRGADELEMSVWSRRKL